MAGIPGPQLDEGTEKLIREYSLGGIILFARNIEDPVQVATLCKNIQEKAMAYQGLPLLIAIDQEGGRVARLGDPFTQFPGNAAIGTDAQPVEKAVEFGQVTAKELRLVGINMDFAPVVDVQRGELEKHLEGRAFGDDPDMVSLLGRTVVRTLQENGVMAVAKHFPGLGRADLDPHVHLPRIEVDSEELDHINLPPFKAAIEEGVSGIMTSHAIYPSLDPKMPATLSSAVLTKLLRENMGYEGMIITDDLEMGAVAESWGVSNSAVRSFEAGADLLLICKNQEYILESIDLLRGKLLKSEISMKRLHLSSDRVSKIQSKLGARKEEISIEQVREYFKL